MATRYHYHPPLMADEIWKSFWNGTRVIKGLNETGRRLPWIWFFELYRHNLNESGKQVGLLWFSVVNFCLVIKVGVVETEGPFNYRTEFGKVQRILHQQNTDSQINWWKSSALLQDRTHNIAEQQSAALSWHYWMENTHNNCGK